MSSKFIRLDTIDELIKSGQVEKAKEQLLDLPLETVYGVDLVFYCSLLRRVGLSLKAVKILNPMIYPKARSAQIATTEEKLEYAACLVRLGILVEAERILNSIDANLLPLVLIRKSFMCISRWDYERSNQFLLQYIIHPKANSYEVLVAKVNLLQGYVLLDEFAKAEALFFELINTLDPLKNRLLLAAVYEFGTELERLKNNYDLSFKYIEHAKRIIGDDNSIDAFLIRKQELILLVYSQLNDENKLSLVNLRDESVRREHYESIRDIDLHLAIINRNEVLLNKVYWGSQSVFYKKRILKLAEKFKLNVNTEFFKFKKNKGHCFDIMSGKMHGANLVKPIKPHQALHRLLTALLSETYKPIRLLDLFDQVYSHEIFFPGSSSDKMHQLIQRLRKFLITNKIPIVFVCNNKTYFLKINANFTLTRGQKYNLPWLNLLQKKYPHRRFCVEEAQILWNCSYRTALRRLQQLKTEQLVALTGKTRSTKYKFG